MSSRAVKAVYRDAPADLGPASMLVLVTLADSVNEEWDWTYVPGVAALAAKAHLSDRAARIAVRDLTDRGLVTKPQRAKTQPLRLAIMDREPARDAGSPGSEPARDAAQTGTSCRSSAPRPLTEPEEPDERDAWAVATAARDNPTIVVRNIRQAVNAVQQVLATGATKDELLAALGGMAGQTLTTGTLGVALSRYRQNATRARRDADEAPARPWWEQETAGRQW